MLKLVNKYLENPTAENLARIKKHVNKHPMAACMLSDDILEAMRNA